MFARPGLWGSYLRVDAATEEPSSFERTRVLLVTSFPGRIDEVVQVTVQDCVYTVVIQEAEFVRILVVEQREEESESELGMTPTGAVWLRQMKQARSLDVVVGRAGASVALDCIGAGRGATLNTADLLTTNACALSSPSVILGDAGTALASILGSVLGGIRKVKSVNCLVEALASPEQRRTVFAAHAHRGHGRSAKTRVLIDAGSDVVNASLTDSDI
ncbi:hypothetical protein V6N12_010238 [Hibiscus sabdariffa]|uniref:Uncharacterized protein n=1 Tax=Hibiscus sabdariffa TaxID=183260 RepID=A0ABR2B3P6_9ROSI